MMNMFGVLVVSVVVSVIDVSSYKVVKELSLPNGSGSLKDLRVSPDGKYAVVTHLVSNFNRATTSVQFGWMNANALTIIDTVRMEKRNGIRQIGKHQWRMRGPDFELGQNG